MFESWLWFLLFGISLTLCGFAFLVLSFYMEMLTTLFGLRSHAVGGIGIPAIRAATVQWLIILMVESLFMVMLCI